MGGKGSQYDLYNYFGRRGEAADARLIDKNATDRPSCIEQSRKRKIGDILDFHSVLYKRGDLSHFRFPPSSICEGRSVAFRALFPLSWLSHYFMFE
jgi:hypothetical protein